MSGHTPGDRLDLDAIEAEHRLFVHPDEGLDMCWQCRVEAPCESLALVAEVRRLREELEDMPGAGLCPHGWAPERCDECKPRYVPRSACPAVRP